MSIDYTAKMMMNKLLLVILSILILFSSSCTNDISSTVVTSDLPTLTPFLNGWENRIKLTIRHSQISSSLTDFPILVNLSNSSGLNKADITKVFDILVSDTNRKKIALTLGDGITQCYVEIEKWDTIERQAFLWVKVPSIYYSVDTILYLYFDINQIDNDVYVGDVGSATASLVWSNGFVEVLHLGEPGIGITGEYMDSTSRGNNATGGDGSVSETPTLTLAKIGYGQNFDGINDYIQISDSDLFSVSTTGELTISFWLSPGVYDFPSASTFIRVLGKGEEGQNEWVVNMYNESSDRPQRISFYIVNPEGGLATGSYTEEPITVDDWVYISGRIDEDYIYIFRNGILSHSPSQYTIPWADAPIITPINGTAPVRIGTRDLKDWFLGRIDEFRISNISRSDAWILASYYSENDQLLFFSDI